MVWIDKNVYEPPMSVKDFTSVSFQDKHIQGFQQTPPNWKARFDSPHRWIGQIGEAAFKKYMEVTKRAVEDKTKIGASWVDFEYPKRNWKIDVKTVGTKLRPTLDYACDVDEDQEKENKEANVYVFCRYVFDEKRVYLLGFIQRERFHEEAIFRKAGEAITPSFTPVKNFYEIPIYKLEKMETL